MLLFLYPQVEEISTVSNMTVEDNLEADIKNTSKVLNIISWNRHSTKLLLLFYLQVEVISSSSNIKINIEDNSNSNININVEDKEKADNDNSPMVKHNILDHTLK